MLESTCPWIWFGRLRQTMSVSRNTGNPQIVHSTSGYYQYAKKSIGGYPNASLLLLWWMMDSFNRAERGTVVFAPDKL
ncbi:hypothetical protein SAMN05216386_0995 [Nitrosospira briensis]|uniref:Uncharacterized protein n=1 Tax=Nitrosospira briensis TaxID=35799 RepID=A0A1I4Z2N5_9PROT|nr:hypothetical protein SAMN05216386_0995 [Nitrosospira briensis]